MFSEDRLSQGLKNLARIVWIEQSQDDLEHRITNFIIVIGEFKLRDQGFRTLGCLLTDDGLTVND